MRMRREAEDKRGDRKVVIVLIGVLVGLLLLGVWIERRRETNREAYAAKYDCEWVWQGTLYGDDRDYICK